MFMFMFIIKFTDFVTIINFYHSNVDVFHSIQIAGYFEVRFLKC